MKTIKKIMIIFVIITVFLSWSSEFVFGADLSNIVKPLDNTASNETEQNSTGNISNSDSEQNSNTVGNETTELDSLNSKKEELQTAVSENEAQISVVESEISATLAEVENLSIKISEKKEEIEDLESEEIALNSYIEETEKNLAEYTEKYEFQKSLLEERLIAMYEMGDVKYLDVLLNSEGLTDFLSRCYLVSEITESDYELVSSVKENKQQMESLSSSLKTKKEELEKDKVDKEKYQVSLSNMEILKNNKISSLNEEELAIYQKIEDYKTEISSVEAEIKKLALENIGETYVGGNMIWPTPGYTTITSNFGMRTHPITGIYKLHTGTDIGAPYGATFVAANDGVVIKAEMNRAYGNMVMINHGGGVITLYAHGSEILVEEGQAVTQGTAVLKVGSTGYSTGPHAHFEIRINGEYVNPLDYISPTNTGNFTPLDETSNENTTNEEITVELNN